MEISPIAKIENGFVTKFGIPRQSRLCTAVSRIVFEPKYRVPEAIRGIEEFSHLWLIWQFSETPSAEFSPTVRPPRLGGNRRVGVFATRSPFRPNSLGLSCVRLVGLEHTKDSGTVLLVSGADLMNGTPIFDIKPYLPYADSIPDAVGGFADGFSDYALKVAIPKNLEENAGEDAAEIISILKNDPRPSYQQDSERVYCFEYKGYSIAFTVSGDTLSVQKLEKENGR